MCMFVWAKSMGTHTFMTDTHTHKLLIHNDKKINQSKYGNSEKEIDNSS